MPYIAFELDAMEAVPDIAAGAGIPEANAGWGLAKLWRRCWREKLDTVTTGAIGCLFSADGGRVASALVALGFLEPVRADTFRVRGAARYLRISEARSEAGKKGGAKTAASGAQLANLKQNRSRPEAIASEPPKQTGSKTEALSASSEQRAATIEQPQEKPLSAAPTPAREVFAHWQEVTGHHQSAFGDKRKRAVKARLAEGYTVEQLKRAIEGCAVTPHNQGKNDRGEVYDDLELICRDAGHVDRFIANAASPPIPQEQSRGAYPDPNSGIIRGAS